MLTCLLDVHKVSFILSPELREHTTQMKTALDSYRALSDRTYRDIFGPLQLFKSSGSEFSKNSKKRPIKTGVRWRRMVENVSGVSCYSVEALKF